METRLLTGEMVNRMAEADSIDELLRLLGDTQYAEFLSTLNSPWEYEVILEDELKEVVARVAGPTIEKLAGEMLEKIVWEVVPDLAEAMIREEIRKIRQGAGE